MKRVDRDKRIFEPASNVKGEELTTCDRAWSRNSKSMTVNVLLSRSVNGSTRVQEIQASTHPGCSFFNEVLQP